MTQAFAILVGGRSDEGEIGCGECHGDTLIYKGWLSRFAPTLLSPQVSPGVGGLQEPLG